MSKFVRTAQTSQSLSLAAMEEASRLGLREADLEHLFLALVLSNQGAGDVMRSLGISIDTARRAVQEQQEAHLARLGIRAQMPEPGRIVFHETAGYDWSERAKALIRRASGPNRDGSATAILRELVDEPSGMVAELLERLGTTPATVLDALERSEPAPARSERQVAPGRGGGSSEVFVPGPVEDVWEFLADPARIPEWNPGIGTVDDAAGTGAPGDTWTARAATTRPNGRRMRVRREFRRRGIELVDAARHARVVWRFTSPDADRSRPIVTEFDLTHAVGGTQVTVTTSWTRPGGWRRLLGVPLRPVQKLFVWLHLFQIGSAISRAFR